MPGRDKIERGETSTRTGPHRSAMSDQHNDPTSRTSALAAQIHAARIGGAFSIETLATLAQVDPEAVAAMENGTPTTDVSAQDRIMDVLGVRLSGHR